MKLAVFFSLLFAPLAILAEVPAENMATKPMPRDKEAGWVARHEKFNAVSKEGVAELVFFGDSITQGWEGNGKEAWAKYWGDYKTANFGIGGDRTEHLLWRMDNGNFDGLKPELVVLMIGTNNTGHKGRDGYNSPPEHTAEGIKAILAKLHEKSPETKVLLLAIFPRGADNTDVMRQQNEAANAIIKGFADDKKVFFMNINDKFLTPEGVLTPDIMPDKLHLTAKGYEIWAEAIAPKVKELMQ